MSCDVDHRCGSDPALLWLPRRLVATAPIRPLACEPPYAAGAALAKEKKKRQNILTYFSNGGKICYALYKDMFSVLIY